MTAIPRANDEQLFWLLRELIRMNIHETDSLVLTLMRHIAGADLSQKNLNLINDILQIFSDYRYEVRAPPQSSALHLSQSVALLEREASRMRIVHVSAADH
jgi:hypothetical protein